MLAYVNLFMVWKQICTTQTLHKSKFQIFIKYLSLLQHSAATFFHKHNSIILCFGPDGLREWKLSSKKINLFQGSTVQQFSVPTHNPRYSVTNSFPETLDRHQTQLSQLIFSSFLRHAVWTLQLKTPSHSSILLSSWRQTQPDLCSCFQGRSANIYIALHWITISVSI